MLTCKSFLVLADYNNECYFRGGTIIAFIELEKTIFLYVNDEDSHISKVTFKLLWSCIWYHTSIMSHQILSSVLNVIAMRDAWPKHQAMTQVLSIVLNGVAMREA